MKKLCLFVVTFAVSKLAFAAGYPGTPLPRSTPEAQGISSAALLPLIEEAEQQELGLHSIMIVRHGHVVAEGWWAPYSADQPHMLFSLSKSFTSTAIGMLQQEGKLSIDDFVLNYFPEDAPAAPSGNLKAMRIRDLLMMSTGQEKEDVDRINPYAPDKTGTKQFLAASVRQKPGTLFYYNSPSTFMASAIAQKVTGQTLRDYLISRLFEPLGIPNPEWDLTPQGISFGASGLHLRTEDIAKFGQLYLQRGEWNGRRILPAAWVDLATSRQTSNGSGAENDWNQGYGYQFWRCIPGFYRGDGAFGQFCIVMPQYDTVVAINSGSNDMGAIMRLIWKRLIPELRPAAIPADEAAASKLRDKLASLAQPTLSGANANAVAAQVSGKTYRLPENPLQLEELTAKFEPQGASLVFRVKGKDYLLGAKASAWTKTESFPQNNSLAPVAATGAWTSDDTYTLKTYYYQSPFITVAKLRFANGELNGEYTVNVGFNKQEPLLLTGKPE